MAFQRDSASGHVLCETHVERARATGAGLGELSPSEGPCALCALVPAPAPSWAPKEEQVGYDTPDAWRAEASRRFGDDPLQWRFVCPSCGHVAKVQDWKDVGAPSGAIAFSCIGRYQKGGKDAFSKKGEGPCNYTTGGLINISPIKVKDGANTQYVFAFAESTHAAT